MPGEGGGPPRPRTKCFTHIAFSVPTHALGQPGGRALRWSPTLPHPDAHTLVKLPLLPSPPPLPPHPGANGLLLSNSTRQRGWDVAHFCDTSHKTVTSILLAGSLLYGPHRKAHIAKNQGQLPTDGRQGTEAVSPTARKKLDAASTGAWGRAFPSPAFR